MSTDCGLRISVVMATRNAEAYLAEALASIATQTLLPMEVVLVDGGSTDATLAIAARFESVRCLAQQGRGLADAWNTGIHACCGDAVAFLDSDDRWAADKLELQSDYLAGHPDIDAVIGEVRFFLEPGQAQPAGFRPSLLEGSHLAAMPGTLLIRRAALEKVGDFDPALNVATDIEWFARLRDHAVPTGALSTVLLYKRVHGANFSYGAARDNTYERDLLRAIHRLRTDRRRHPGGVTP